jgi:hypothetical protein
MLDAAKTKTMVVMIKAEADQLYRYICKKRQHKSKSKKDYKKHSTR